MLRPIYATGDNYLEDKGGRLSELLHAVSRTTLTRAVRTGEMG